MNIAILPSYLENHLSLKVLEMLNYNTKKYTEYTLQNITISCNTINSNIFYLKHFSKSILPLLQIML